MKMVRFIEPYVLRASKTAKIIKRAKGIVYVNETRQDLRLGKDRFTGHFCIFLLELWAELC